MKTQHEKIRSGKHNRGSVTACDEEGTKGMDFERFGELVVMKCTVFYRKYLHY